MFSKFWQTSIVIMAALFISACDQVCSQDCEDNGTHCQKECPVGHCVDADDWGYPKIWVPAGTDDSALVLQNPEPSISTGNSALDSIISQIEGMSKTISLGDYPNQTVVPIDSQQILLDAHKIPLVISVGRRDEWTSWFGGDMNPKDDDGTADASGWDGGRVITDLECHYSIKGLEDHPDSNNFPSSQSGSFADDLSPQVVNKDKNCSELVPNDETLYSNCFTPCYLRYGMGLYVGFAPGDTPTSKASDVVFTYHIPDATSPGVSSDDALAGLDSTSILNDNASDPALAISKLSNANLERRGMDGYLVRGFAADLMPGAETRDRLYFKIMDNYYSDNQGGYMVKIKEGTRNVKPGPLETITSTLLEPVFIIMRRLYEGVVDNQSYIQGVRALLALYIVFYGFVFMIGGVEEAKKAVQFRILKIAVIVAVISPGSFDFFYNHMFSFFMEGVMNVAALLVNPFGDYDPQNPWYSMDLLLAKFFSAETWAKAQSTIFSNIPLGILAIIVIYASMALFVIALFKALLVYLVGFIGMAILVVLFPIFIVFILFDKTKELFKEVVDQFLAISIQEILLLASLGMFAAIIVGFLERTIGYRVCFNTWADFDFFGTPSTHVFGLKYWMPDITYDMSNLWVDANGDGVRQLVPPEMAYRYIDLPYLDPVYDKTIVARYMLGKNFLEIGDLVLLAGATYLMMLFMENVPTIADSLASGGSSPAESASIMASGGRLFNSFVGAGKGMVSDSMKAAKNLKSLSATLASTSGGDRAKVAIRRGGAAAGNAMQAGAEKVGDSADALKKKIDNRNLPSYKAIGPEGAAKLMRDTANAAPGPRGSNRPSTLSSAGGDLSPVQDGNSHANTQQQHDVQAHEVDAHVKLGANLSTRDVRDFKTEQTKKQEAERERYLKEDADKENKKPSASTGQRSSGSNSDREKAAEDYARKAAEEKQRETQAAQKAAEAKERQAADRAQKENADRTAKDQLADQQAKELTLTQAQKLEAEQASARAAAKNAAKQAKQNDLIAAKNELKTLVEGDPRRVDLEKKISSLEKDSSSTD